jgi:hypothetical protein
VFSRSGHCIYCVVLLAWYPIFPIDQDHPTFFCQYYSLFSSPNISASSFLISSIWPWKMQLLIAKAILKMFQTNEFTLISFMYFRDRGFWPFHFSLLLPQLRSMLMKNTSILLLFCEKIALPFSAVHMRR